VNRIVVFIVGPIAAGLAGYGADVAMKYLPGHPVLDKSQLAAVAVAAVVTVGTHINTWLKGWQAHEARKSYQNATIAEPAPPSVPAKPPSRARTTRSTKKT
jgi:hypothetical protein